MENASKALLMAGGVLIAIITIALLVNTFSTVNKFQMSQLSQKEQEELIAFNEQYTKYLNQYVYGTEVITVINKSLNNKDYKIATIIEFINEEYTYTTYEYKNGKRVSKTNTVRAGKELKITNEDDNIAYDVINNPAKESDSLKNRAFKCTKIEYDNSNGRVKSITFEEKKWGHLY